MPAGSPPPRRRPKNLAGYLEALSRPVFQAGISWRVVDGKWDGIRTAFKEFEPDKVARFGPKQIDALLANEAMIRSRPKIEAVIDNAHTLLELDKEHGGFRKYLKAQGDTPALAADLQRSSGSSAHPAPTPSFGWSASRCRRMTSGLRPEREDGRELP